MRELLDRTHNTWFNTDDKTLPLWNVLVANHVHVLFVFHHSIADGVGGTAFHGALLAALNFVSNSSTTVLRSFQCQIMIYQKTTSRSSHHKSKSFHPPNHSLVHLHHDPPLSPPKQALVLQLRKILHSRTPFTSCGNAENRAVTRVQSRRLDRSVLGKCLAACKKTNTTFTSLLATLIDVTLATDIYPESKSGYWLLR